MNYLIQDKGSNPFKSTNLIINLYSLLILFFRNMNKFVITSGKSVVSYFDNTIVHITNTDNPKYYNTIGEAMKDTILVNKLLNTNSFRVMSIN